MKKLLVAFFIVNNTFLAAPPPQIPAHLYNDYTMDGKIAVQSWYLDGTVSEHSPIVFKQETVRDLIAQIKKGKTFYYGATDLWLYQALKKYSINNQKVAIFGSVQPIYESVCLCYGGSPITIEYNKWTTDHPDLVCMTPAEYDNNPILFDAGFSISSFEHDGLGRYGDPINPWGDLETMQKVKTMIKPNGLLFLAVPVGKDTLVWNAHRIYGKIRLPLLLNGWKIIDVFGIKGLHDPLLNQQSNIQPVFVLQNSSS